MKVINWKTTLTGLITALTNLAVLVGIDLTPEQTTVVVSSVTTIGVFIISILAKDKDVTGGTKPQNKESEGRLEGYKIRHPEEGG